MQPCLNSTVSFLKSLYFLAALLMDASFLAALLMEASFLAALLMEASFLAALLMEASFLAALLMEASFLAALFRAGLTVAEPALASSLAKLAFLVVCSALINDFFWMDIAELLLT